MGSDALLEARSHRVRAYRRWLMSLPAKVRRRLCARRAPAEVTIFGGVPPCRSCGSVERVPVIRAGSRTFSCVACQERAWKAYRARNAEKYRAIDRERKRREYAANPEPFKARARKAWVLRKRRVSAVKEVC